MATKRSKLVPRTHVPRPFPVEHWSKDEAKRSRLAELIMDPVMQEAFATLAGIYGPAAPSYISSESANGVMPAADLNNLLAHRHSHRAGFFGFRTALENLTRDKVLRRAERAPWGEFIPEDQ